MNTKKKHFSNKLMSLERYQSDPNIRKPSMLKASQNEGDDKRTKKKFHFLSTRNKKKAGTLKSNQQSLKYIHTEERDDELTSIIDQKHKLYARISSLKHEIKLVKDQNKTLKSTSQRTQLLEEKLTEAYAENKTLRSRQSWDKLKLSMKSFKVLLDQYLEYN